MKVLLKHWLIKNENIFDVDALMTSTIITVTRPFFLLWYIYIYIYICVCVCEGIKEDASILCYSEFRA